jgi:hypothetical protein
MQTRLSLALDDATRSSPALAAEGIAWAQENQNGIAKDNDSVPENAILSAALIGMPDGDADLRAEQDAWARDVFSTAFRALNEPTHRSSNRVRHNPVATAFVGLPHLLAGHPHPKDISTLLEVAADKNSAAAPGFGAVATTLAVIHDRLPRALLRCGFAARIQSQDHADAEASWLRGETSEPDWPVFPFKAVHLQRPLRIPGLDQPEPPPPRTPTYRGCALIERLWHQTPSELTQESPLRSDLDQFITALVRLGVAEAHQLELDLATSVH